MLKKIFFNRAVYYILLAILMSLILFYLRTTFLIGNEHLWLFIYLAVSGLFGLFLGLVVQRMQSALYTDELTNLANYKSLQKTLEEELETVNKTGQDLSMIMIDIDNFKQVNDERGHIIADQLLKNLAKLLKENFPKTSSIFCWGGEEFIVLLPKTNNKKALFLADNFRKRVKSSNNFENNTVSIGLATCNFNIGNVSFFDLVDDAMYQAKKTRDAVCNSGYFQG